MNHTDLSLSLHLQRLIDLPFPLPIVPTNFSVLAQRMLKALVDVGTSVNAITVMRRLMLEHPNPRLALGEFGD